MSAREVGETKTVWAAVHVETQKIYLITHRRLIKESRGGRAVGIRPVLKCKRNQDYLDLIAARKTQFSKDDPMRCAYTMMEHNLTPEEVGAAMEKARRIREGATCEKA